MNKIDAKSTREAYGGSLLKVGIDERVVVLDADLAVSTQTAEFRDRFRDRFFDVGCAEQNLIGTAMGISYGGKIVFASTYSIFAMRAWEMIRMACHDGLNIKIVTSHSGLTNAVDGASHQCLEDIALMRVLPNMEVFIPVDAVDTERVIEYCMESHGMTYIRLNREKTPIVFDETHEFEPGVGNIIVGGSDITLIACGTMVDRAIKASKILSKKDISARVINLSSIKPMDKDMVLKCAKETNAIITIEEHSIYGGLGSAVAEILSERFPVKMKIMGVEDKFGQSGTYEELINFYGLHENNIVENVINLIKEK
ncbi:MAG: transketolase [Candidatus Altiarchaeales archaeon WOR_SM1_86-2]|nr:MAG: transketolase [Candidatus Altiarchaeales archaeon WOR_SM1_86-2]